MYEVNLPLFRIASQMMVHDTCTCIGKMMERIVKLSGLILNLFVSVYTIKYFQFRVNPNPYPYARQALWVDDMNSFYLKIKDDS